MARPGEPDRADEERFEAMYLAHVDELLAFASRRTTRTEAEDVVAETFIRAYRSLPVDVWRDERQRRIWLFRVVRNQLISLHRRRSTADASAHLVARSSTSEDLHEGGSVDQVLSGLEERQRTVLELRFVHDLDVAATAQMLEITPEAVRALTYRAPRWLRAVLPGPADESDAVPGSPRSAVGRPGEPDPTVRSA